MRSNLKLQSPKGFKSCDDFVASAFIADGIKEFINEDGH